MTLTLTQGRRDRRNLELVQSFCLEWHEIAHTLSVDEYEGEYGRSAVSMANEYGSFEQLHILFY